MVVPTRTGHRFVADQLFGGRFGAIIVADVRVQFADFPGRIVYHCHIFDDEDAGMMATVQVLLTTSPGVDRHW
ncbi:multicopper oxidase domain-containing protein [Amycolatopsis roodepoortensis]|uniref:multicopper oxidase domain-containing protein n=1 Tax=Amycolatopsis roodepoortensis TaxID=700274 RepID=UPI00214C13E0|nr:multicopper oxidase domain-containing protein [Amycolatopsis roodepoortensis]UUV28662.1 multicopper oxidase domain-containing protein [Amycolatopsis roodepoortensis]